MARLSDDEVKTLFNEFGLHAPGAGDLRGVPITIGAKRNEHGMTVRATANRRSVQRRAPLAPPEAAGLVAELNHIGAGLPQEASFDALVSHVLEKLGRLAERADVTEFSVLAHFTPHDYSIERASVSSPSAGPVEKRLPKHRFSDATRIVRH